MLNRERNVGHTHKNRNKSARVIGRTGSLPRKITGSHWSCIRWGPLPQLTGFAQPRYNWILLTTQAGVTAAQGKQAQGKTAAGTPGHPPAPPVVLFWPWWSRGLRYPLDKEKREKWSLFSCKQKRQREKPTLFKLKSFSVTCQDLLSSVGPIQDAPQPSFWIWYSDKAWDIIISVFILVQKSHTFGGWSFCLRPTQLA